MSIPAPKCGMRPVHAGEILREEFMKPLGISANALAIALRVPATRIHAIVKEKRGISPDTALRLARYFDTSVEFWLNIQNDYDIEIARTTFDPQEIKPLALA